MAEFFMNQMLVNRCFVVFEVQRDLRRYFSEHAP